MSFETVQILETLEPFFPNACSRIFLIATIFVYRSRGQVCRIDSGFSPTHALPFQTEEFWLCENRSRGLQFAPNIFVGG